ncbi:hypothetical protein F183_A04360 [Bryobacterales bacterium F-183]|nr:hypothetical protein F183_A04360 [Bryobacterales bacterium F-183]
MSSKSSEKAKQSLEKSTGSSGTQTVPVGQTSQPCPLEQKHYIRIVVKDETGKPVKDAKPKLVGGGTTIDAAPLDDNGRFDTGKTLDGTDPVEISFPTLFNCDWHASDTGEAAPVGNTSLPPIADGDCVISLAAAKGYRSYKDIWTAPENNALKTDRPSPGSLVVGDVLKAPGSKEKKVTKPVDAEWTFIVKSLKKPKLRIIVVDHERKPLPNCDWTLTGVASKTGKTGADGLIEILDIDPTAKDGTLKITPPPPIVRPEPPVTVPPVPDPPPYPMAIKAGDFKDEAPDTKELTVPFEFVLKIGSLPAHKHKTGVTARMRNYGFLTADNPTDDQIKAGVKAYQREIEKKDAPTGAFADIQEDLETRHTKA